MEDRPEEIGERLVLQESRVLKQPEEEVPPLLKVAAEVLQVRGIDGDPGAVVLEAVAHPGKRLRRPGLRHDEPFPEFGQFGVAIRYEGEEPGPGLGEEGPDDHVQLLKPLALCPDAQELVQDKGDEEDVDREEPEGVEYVGVGVLRIAEQEVLYRVDGRRRGDQNDTEAYFPCPEGERHAQGNVRTAGRIKVGPRGPFRPGGATAPAP